MKKIAPNMDLKGKTVAIITSRWNELVTKALLEGAIETLEPYGVEIVTVSVSGTWEIPVIASALIKKQKVDGIVALGCILQGQTPHAQLLANDVGAALMGLQVKKLVPISWGILTPDTEEQALSRAGLKHGNKGREAASAVLEQMGLIQVL